MQSRGFISCVWPHPGFAAEVLALLSVTTADLAA